MDNQLLRRARIMYKRWDQCGLTDNDKFEVSLLSRQACVEHNYHAYRIFVKILDAYGYGGYSPYQRKRILKKDESVPRI